MTDVATDDLIALVLILVPIVLLVGMIIWRLR
jgi:hypothetical protein